MAHAWRLLLAALAAARPVAGAHEKYVIQAFDPAHIGAIDAKPPARRRLRASRGATPTRGAVWVTPQQLHNYDGSSTFEPSTFALYDANTTVTVAIRPTRPSTGSAACSRCSRRGRGP